MTAGADDSLTQTLADEAAKARKLEIIFGPWWRHYAVPYEFPATLYVERSTCPYCGGPLGMHALSSLDALAEDQSAHLDHMDPLSRGGEDSIRNTAYVCSGCNLAKGRRPFVDWLEKLAAISGGRAAALPGQAWARARGISAGRKAASAYVLPRYELSFDESVLLKLFPKPIVSGPPIRE